MSKKVTVTWEDSCATGGWLDPNTIDRTPCLCETTGYLVERTDRYVLVALNKNLEAEGRYGDYISIPAVAVKKVRNLK